MRVAANVGTAVTAYINALSFALKKASKVITVTSTEYLIVIYPKLNIYCKHCLFKNKEKIKFVINRKLCL
jgi:hypothetical protein